jgi:Flp pilus assembly pilin Flp
MRLYSLARRGQALTEWAVGISVIALAVIISLSLVFGGVGGVFSGITSSINTVTGPGSSPSSGPAPGATLTCISITPLGTQLLPISIPLGGSQQFTATGHYSDGSNSGDLTSTVTWSTYSTVATINSSGLAQGISGSTEGPDPINAQMGTPGGTIYQCPQSWITVTHGDLTGVALTPATASVAVGQSLQFTVAGTYADNTVANITGAVTSWTSSAPSVATVDSGGLALAVSSTLGDTTTITATISSFSPTAVLTIADGTGVTIPPETSVTAPWAWTPEWPPTESSSCLAPTPPTPSLPYGVWSSLANPPAQPVGGGGTLTPLVTGAGGAGTLETPFNPDKGYSLQFPHSFPVGSTITVLLRVTAPADYDQALDAGISDPTANAQAQGISNHVQLGVSVYGVGGGGATLMEGPLGLYNLPPVQTPSINLTAVGAQGSQNLAAGLGSTVWMQLVVTHNDRTDPTTATMWVDGQQNNPTTSFGNVNHARNPGPLDGISIGVSGSHVDAGGDQGTVWTPYPSNTGATWSIDYLAVSSTMGCN